MWCTPAFGYARLDDAASTGSSLMPQKRNPDPFELVRANARDLTGRFAGALATMSGTALSYHRDLQITKAAIIAIVEHSLRTLEAFARALAHVEFVPDRMNAAAGANFTAATDVADALILQGLSAREAHATIGAQVLASERGTSQVQWPDARACVEGKQTSGSTNPAQVAKAIAQLQSAIAQIAS